jgi:hypothetical protein
MPYIVYFQTESPSWIVPVIGGVALVTAATVGALVTWLSMRPKTKADTIKIMTETSKLLAEQLKSGAQDLTLAMGTITRLEKEKQIFGAQAEKAEQQLVKSDEIITGLRAEAALIIENIQHLSFIPSDDPPNDTDASAIRRLKEMKIAARKMQEVI